MFPSDERFFKVTCKDKKCQAVLHINHVEKNLECYVCGQKFHINSLQDVQEVSPSEIKNACNNFLRRVVYNRIAPKRGTEMVKVQGLSNYYCKLLSPLLTRYGMDKSTGRAKLLTEMNQGEIFDCSLFGDRAFLIEPEHIPIAGFGKDITGSVDYLSETLKLVVASNGGEDRLIPIHADGDGHCLVHAISRALVGRELFWHPLRCCLKKHFKTNLDKYKELFKDFIDSCEWIGIIEECDPDFRPPEGELHGLRNIHIFGLANVLRRPIMLLDSLDCMKKCGDYSALFIPGFVPPEACKGKDGTLNKPLCIAWSSPSHNHYIPLVGIQNAPLPVMPASLIPKVWGMPQSQVYSYIQFDADGSCVIGGNRSLTDGYIQRLVHAMEVQFYDTHGIHPSLVADYKLYYCSDNLLFPMKPSVVIERAKAVAQENRLYRCLYCKALNEFQLDESIFADGVKLNQIRQSCRRWPPDQTFMIEGYCLKYDRQKNEVFVDWSRSEMKCCGWCACNNVRRVTSDGTVIFKAEDKDNPDKGIYFAEQSKKFYPEENVLPSFSTNSLESQKVSLKLQWNKKEVHEEISGFDFRGSSKEQTEEFIKEMTNKLIKKHFTDDSGEALQSYISDEMWKSLRQTVLNMPSKSESEKNASVIPGVIKKETLASASPKPPPSELRYVKVVTSNGEQANFSLGEEGVSFGQLQEWIKNEFKIPVPQQRVKMGFPPKEVIPSSETNKQMLPLSHGDRLMVEVLKPEDSYASALNDISMAWDKLESAQSQTSQPQTFTKFQNDIVWDMIKQSPKNFRRNGDIYNQIAESNMLHENLHTRLEGFPDKVFAYNPLEDSIYLCVKPLGHFLISNDIEERIEAVRNQEYVLGYCKCPLQEKLSKMSSNKGLKKTDSVPSSEEEDSHRPLLRKGPGWSVLRNPADDMDLS